MHLFRAVAFFVCVNACAQVTVPRLIRYSGSYHGVENRGGAVGATFSIHRGEYDTSPLWTEIQNVQPDASGDYTALLGSTRSEGMPVELFFTTEPRWLEVEIDGVKQPRVLLSSVSPLVNNGRRDASECFPMRRI